MRGWMLAFMGGRMSVEATGCARLEGGLGFCLSKIIGSDRPLLIRHPGSRDIIMVSLRRCGSFGRARCVVGSSTVVSVVERKRRRVEANGKGMISVSRL